MKNSELKPCPFCGAKAILVTETNVCFGHGSYGNRYYVTCTECYAKGKSVIDYADTKKECIENCRNSWNRRPEKCK